MFKNIITIVIILIGLFFFAGNQTSSACVNSASVSASDDGGLPVQQTYDPCDYWVSWTFTLTRNYDDSGTHVVVRFEVNGAGVLQDFDSLNFYHGETKTATGQKEVGPSTSNTVKISKLTGAGTKFTNLQNSVTYENGNSERP